MVNEDSLIVENIKSIARARGVKFDFVIESLAEAVKNGVKRKFGKEVESEVVINKSTGDIVIFIIRKITKLGMNSGYRLRLLIWVEVRLNRLSRRLHSGLVKQREIELWLSMTRRSAKS